MDILSSSTPHHGNVAHPKSCASQDRAPPIKPASGQDLMCCDTQRNVRLTRGPNSSDAVECSYSYWVRPSMTSRSPWSNRIWEGVFSGARRRNLNRAECPRLILTMTFGSNGDPNKRPLSRSHGIHDPSPENRFRFTPVGTSHLAHQGVRRDATLLHSLTASVKTEGLACGRTAPCP